MTPDKTLQAIDNPQSDKTLIAIDRLIYQCGSQRLRSGGAEACRDDVAQG